MIWVVEVWEDLDGESPGVLYGPFRDKALAEAWVEENGYPEPFYELRALEYAETEVHRLVRSVNKDRRRKR